MAAQRLVPLPKIWARAEEKKGEHRSILTPATARELIGAGYEVHVERNPLDPEYQRIFQDSEFESVGCIMEPTYGYKTVDTSYVIFGLKELPESSEPISHTHLSFMHLFKNQSGWKDTMRRFINGGGSLYDLEFLSDATGRRVAAFGFYAGFAGAALAAKTWAWQQTHKGQPLPSVSSFTNGRGFFEDEAALLSQIKGDLDEAIKISGIRPRAMVLGSKGRCGSGAIDCFVKLHIPELVRWDMKETSIKPGPYSEIGECEIFMNCIYLNEKIPPFTTIEHLSNPNRRLTVVGDVSCDPTSPNNPLPIYTKTTTFDEPTVPVEIEGKPLDVIAIDHLPSLLPRESSERYSSDLLPTMLELGHRSSDPVWQGAQKIFEEKRAEAAS